MLNTSKASYPEATRCRYEVLGELRVEFVRCHHRNCKKCQMKECIQDQRLVKLIDDVTFILPSGAELTIKKGFVFDGASIPRICWSTTGHPLDHAFALSALLHDGIYAAEKFSRSHCDWLFLDFMQKHDRVSFYQRNKMWIAVRLFGGAVWKGHTQNSVAQARKFVEFRPPLLDASPATA